MEDSRFAVSLLFKWGQYTEQNLSKVTSFSLIHCSNTLSLELLVLLPQRSCLTHGNLSRYDVPTVPSSICISRNLWNVIISGYLLCGRWIKWSGISSDRQHHFINIINTHGVALWWGTPTTCQSENINKSSSEVH